VRISRYVTNAEDWCRWNLSLIKSLLPLLGISPAKHSLKNRNQDFSVFDPRRIGSESSISNQSFQTCGVAEILPLMIVSYREN